MTTKERVLQAICRAVDDVNLSRPPESQIGKSADAVLFGGSGILDSLGLVQLIITTEQEIQEEFGAGFALADEKAMSQRNSPFQSISSLSDYITGLLDEATDA